MHRRVFTSNATAALLCLPLLTIPSIAAAPPRPNIFVVLSDDHSAAHVGCYGNPDIRTPNLDRFAAQAMRFDRAYVACRNYVFCERGAHGSGLPTNSAAFDLGRCVITKKHKLIYNALWQIPYTPVDFAGDAFWLELQQMHKDGKLAPEMSRLYFAPLATTGRSNQLEGPECLQGSGLRRYPSFGLPCSSSAWGPQQRPGTGDPNLITFAAQRPMFELFDLEADPAELKNLAGTGEAPAVEKDLKGALQEWMILQRDFVPLPVPPPPVKPKQ